MRFNLLDMFRPGKTDVNNDTLSVSRNINVHNEAASDYGISNAAAIMRMASKHKGAHTHSLTKRERERDRDRVKNELCGQSK